MKKIFLVLGIISLVAVASKAELTSEDTHSPEFLKNSGYSSSFIKSVQKLEAMNNGEEYTEPVEKEYYNEKPISIVRKIFMYLDPSLDNHSFTNNHDIKTSPSYTDL